MTDYQNDYKVMYEELRSLTRLYFEILYDEEIEDDDEWHSLLESTELDLCVLVGLIDYEELDD